MEPANFPEIYTGNEDESDRMQDIAGCFDPIIPRNDGFQYDIEAAASDVCHGKDKWKLPILPALHLRRGLMNLPEATDPFGI